MRPCPSSVSVPFQFQDPETHQLAERAAYGTHYNSRRILSSTAYTGPGIHHESAPGSLQRPGAREERRGRGREEKERKDRGVGKRERDMDTALKFFNNIHSVYFQMKISSSTNPWGNHPAALSGIPIPTKQKVEPQWYIHKYTFHTYSMHTHFSLYFDGSDSWYLLLLHFTSSIELQGTTDC